MSFWEQVGGAKAGAWGQGGPAGGGPAVAGTPSAISSRQLSDRFHDF